MCIHAAAAMRDYENIFLYYQNTNVEALSRSHEAMAEAEARARLHLPRESAATNTSRISYKNFA